MYIIFLVNIPYLFKSHEFVSVLLHYYLYSVNVINSTHCQCSFVNVDLTGIFCYLILISICMLSIFSHMPPPLPPQNTARL